MVLVQFIITSANNDSYFTVPISGKCCIRVLNAMYHGTGSATVSYVVQIRSDLLYFPYSPARYLTLVSNPQAHVNYDSGFKEYNLQNVVLQGQIRLAVVDNATGAAPANFQHCVLTLQVESMNENFNPHNE
jgi:hypothetical protein